MTTHVFCREISFCELATQTVLFTKIKVVLFVVVFFFLSKTPSTKVAKCIFRYLDNGDVTSE